MLDAVYGVFEDLFDPDQASVCFIWSECFLQIREAALSAMLIKAILKLFSLISEDID